MKISQNIKNKVGVTVGVAGILASSVLPSRKVYAGAPVLSPKDVAARIVSRVKKEVKIDFRKKGTLRKLEKFGKKSIFKRSGKGLLVRGTKDCLFKNNKESGLALVKGTKIENSGSVQAVMSIPTPFNKNYQQGGVIMCAKGRAAADEYVKAVIVHRSQQKGATLEIFAEARHQEEKDADAVFSKKVALKDADGKEINTREDFYLRLDRDGDIFTAYIRQGDKKWREVCSLEVPLSEYDLIAGLYTSNGGASADARVNYKGVRVLTPKKAEKKAGKKDDLWK